MYAKVCMGEHETLLADLEKKLNYRFINIELLKDALRHPDCYDLEYVQKNKFKRLTVFGDKVANMVMAELFLEQYPGDTGTDIALRLNRAIANITFDQMALALGLDNFLPEDIQEDQRIAPKALADMFEAVCAAIYTDAKDGMLDGLAVIKNIFVGQNIRSLVRWTNLLQEFCITRFNISPVYEQTQSFNELNSEENVFVKAYVGSVLVGNGYGRDYFLARNYAARRSLHSLIFNDELFWTVRDHIR